MATKYYAKWFESMKKERKNILLVFLILLLQQWFKIACTLFGSHQYWLKAQLQQNGYTGVKNGHKFGIW